MRDAHNVAKFSFILSSLIIWFSYYFRATNIVGV